MMNTVFTADWHAQISTRLDNFIATGTMVLDDVFDDNDLTALQQESGFITYKAAHLTHGERMANIRGDSIRWIDESCPAGMAYLASINALGRYFNQSLYTGIRHAEAHYACYPSGFGYQWHTDNPKGRDERVISAVFYLNDDWTDSDGGQITVIDKQGRTIQLLPKLGRLVIFDSNLLHQVEITHRQRFSIATWLRRDDGVL
ncbi:2OG-Fe(II) oxygenase [Moraxella sp. VT-16-12]|uniref:2OG-Fe(II) oxygenase n=1 Tax=Moraxella sp. VT-16-12 TaxID=2014877 RepID=UPI000B7E4913|nr:2OG-Fe(II) oxygenase [Moraxella sp. VT-16-12]TWV81250.1 2OG-Fe(II) oxygenase [Moraxella sp. VT-16-12]